VVADVGGLTSKLKENPSLLIFPQKDKDKDREKASRRQLSSPEHGQ
jgi:hypothetical protein